MKAHQKCEANQITCSKVSEGKQFQTQVIEHCLVDSPDYLVKNHPETKTRLIQMHEARERGEPIPDLHTLHPAAGVEGDSDPKTADGLPQTEGEMPLEPPRKKARRINRKANATGGKGEWTAEEKKQFHDGIIQHGWGNWKESKSTGMFPPRLPAIKAYWCACHN